MSSDLSAADKRAVELLKKFIAQTQTTPTGRVDIQEEDESEPYSASTEERNFADERIYDGVKTPQNEFILDDTRITLDSLPKDIRDFVALKRKVAQERDASIAKDEGVDDNQPLPQPAPPVKQSTTEPLVRQRGETESAFRKRQDDQLKNASKKRKTTEPSAVPRSSTTTPEQADRVSQNRLLSLETLRAQLLLPNSLIANLFFESRLSNLLSWFSKIKSRYASIEKALSELKGASTTSTTTTATKRESETNQAEIKFYELIAARIVTLAAKIRREIIDMGAVLRIAKSARDDPYENMRRTTAERKLRSNSSVETDYDKEVTRYKQRLIQRFVAAIDDMQRMIGLVQLKNDVARYLISSIMQLDDYKLFQDHINIMLFGQPGTGKTASAKKIANLLRIVGVVADDEPSSFIDYGRSELVAEFEGQTAIKTRQAFAACYGSVMLIDEFYQLISKAGQDSSGQEALDSIVKLSENFKGEVLLIAAGYEQAIRNRIFTSNEGVSSRFPNQWRLPNYSSSQLTRIAQLRNVPRGSDGSSSIDDDNRSDADSDYTDRQFVGVKLNGVEVGDNFDQDVNRVLTELIGRAWEANLFENENARGARNLLSAIRDQKAVRIYGSIINKRTDEADQEALVSAPYEVVDVYRGFATWAKNAKKLAVYYTDARVDQLVS